jgi:hypothetical protein
VAVLEPTRNLVLHASYRLFGEAFDPHAGPVPAAYVDGIWVYHLRPAPGDATRLVVRSRNRGRPRWLLWMLAVMIFEPVHFIMQTRQFHNMRARVAAQV